MALDTVTFVLRSTNGLLLLFPTNLLTLSLEVSNQDELKLQFQKISACTSLMPARGMKSLLVDELGKAKTRLIGFDSVILETVPLGLVIT